MSLLRAEAESRAGEATAAGSVASTEAKPGEGVGGTGRRRSRSNSINATQTDSNEKSRLPSQVSDRKEHEPSTIIDESDGMKPLRAIGQRVRRGSHHCKFCLT